VNRKWVLDASPLITLGKVSKITLLEKMGSDLVVPEGVVSEVDQGPADDPAKKWIRGEGSSLVRRLDHIPPLVLSWDLGRGETEVISWAYLNPGYEAILDDRAARNCAYSLEIRVRGTIGIILLAKKGGVLPLIKPLLFHLLESGARMSPDLFRAACKLADEE
jgi:predicted nucleic acid-binding protein